jgi:hypothetical protein
MDMEMEKKYKLISLSLLCLWGANTSEMYALGADADLENRIKRLQIANGAFQDTIDRYRLETEKFRKENKELRTENELIKKMLSDEEALQKKKASVNRHPQRGK